MYPNFLKRVFDGFASFILLFLLSPLFIVLIIFLLFYNKGKVFYAHKRPGICGKPFYMYKFRTLSDTTHPSGQMPPDHLRVTPVRRYLRKMSFDELPQLVNILKGDMSLVGPRPLLMEYLPLYDSFQSRRHEVRPGLTGWAQVNGRKLMSWPDKFKADVWYVDRISFWLDLRILLMTLKVAFGPQQNDIAPEKEFELFRGNKKSTT